MIRRLWRGLVGYIVITVEGRRVEEFLNTMARAGILVWGVERFSTGMLVARMEASGLKRARPLCRHRGWQISVADRIGLPFIFRRLFRRKSLFGGAVAALICLYIASGYIWFVHVEGTEGHLMDEVLTVAQEAGLTTRVRANSFDPKEVQLALMLNIEELSWAAVNVRGTRAVIEVAERVHLDENWTRPGDIVASRDGIVEKIAVSQGYPLVHEGETVRAGDILISGFIPPDDPRHRQRLGEGKTPYVRADGVVTARVWYEGNSRVRLMVQQFQGTGRVARAWQMDFGDKSFRWGRGASRYEQFETDEKRWTFSLFGHMVGLTYARYFESVIHRYTLTEEEAGRQAFEIALADLESQLPPDAQIVDGPYFETSVLVGEMGPVIHATVRAELVEDIRSYRVYP